MRSFWLGSTSAKTSTSLDPRAAAPRRSSARSSGPVRIRGSARPTCRPTLAATRRLSPVMILRRHAQAAAAGRWSRRCPAWADRRGPGSRGRSCPASSSLSIGASAAESLVGDAQRAKALGAAAPRSAARSAPRTAPMSDDLSRPASRPCVQTSSTLASAPLVIIRCAPSVRDQDAQALAEEVVGDLVELPAAGHVERALRADGLVDRVGEARLEDGVEVGVEQDLVALAARRRPARHADAPCPSVRVPVLSEQSTFMLPKFSIEASRLTITFCRGHALGAVGQVDADDRRQQLRRQPDGQRQREQEGVQHRAVRGRR